MIPTNGLIDFHCHLDLYPDHAAAVQEAEAAGVFTLAVTTTPKAWSRNHELTRDTRHVRAGLGLHPQLVSSRADEIALWETLLPQTRYVGEVGLDAGPRFYKSLHWFTGSKSEAARALDMGCYFSVNGTMLNSEKAAALVRSLPVDRMLTETDGPFTAVDDRPSKPIDVAGTVKALAKLLDLAPTSLANAMRDNLRQVLQDTDLR